MFLKAYSFWLTLICLQGLLNTWPLVQDSSISSQTTSPPRSSSRLNENKFISINGIEQWVTIKGNPEKPVILFLHGGPGSVLSPYSDHLYKTWENDFTLVQWDQRGAGRTFGRQAPEELTKQYLQAYPLTIEQMAADGIALSEYLCQQLGKRKLILFGTSWGSALGVTMATKRPDLFYAYVGHSQIVDPSKDERLYNQLYRLASTNKDTTSLNKLNQLGKPPYERAKMVGQLWKIVKKYESKNAVSAPEGWFIEAPAYDNAKDNQAREDGDDYSFVNFVGDKALSVPAMRSSINFQKTHLDFKIPIYLIQGVEDILTPKESTKLYFDRLKAPRKHYVLLAKAAHGFNQRVVATQYKTFKSIKAF